MNEINKPEIKLTQPVAKAPHTDAKVDNKQKEDVNAKDYKEAVAAPGAEAAGRAMLLGINKASKADNIEADIQKIIANPKLLDQSEVLFNAAEQAGVPYPAAASFATSELG